MGESNAESAIRHTQIEEDIKRMKREREQRRHNQKQGITNNVQEIKPDTDYNKKTVPASYEITTKKTVDPDALAACKNYMKTLEANSAAGTMTIGDAVNLAILEEVINI
jgi:hypothetical protein